MSRLWLSLAVTVAGLTDPAVADIIHVPEEQPTLLAAVLVAFNGDEIIVADGVYSGPANRYVDFLGKRIILRSENGPDTCIIDCGSGGPAFIFQNSEPPETMVKGFTIINGRGDGASTGGAISCKNGARPTIINCIIQNCDAQSGGGLLTSSSPTFIRCRFINNRTTSSGPGGAIRVDGPSAFPILINCDIIGNQSDASGQGGAIYVSSEGAAVRLVNCTVAFNTDTGSGSGIFLASATSLIADNCIIWGNTPDQIAGDTSSSTVSFTDIQGGWSGSGTNNISANPQFVDQDGPDDDPETFPDNDYRLSFGSPCIDAGINWGVPADTSDLDGDTDTSELTPLDLDGNPRFSNDVATADTGCGATAVVDMGAYEFPGNALNCLRPGDVNGDETVNVLDLIELLLAFGSPCDVECCLADFDLSGSVDVLDLIELLLAFGQTCP